MQKILKKNDELTVVIERLGANGEGIATFEGKVIFIPFALVGETVKIHIINDKNSFYVAKVLEIITPSKEREIARCPYFTKCGGCDIQHIKYQNQLKLKREIVKNSLVKYAKLDIEVDETVQSEKEFRYRNKFAFPVQEQNGKIAIGMFRKNSHNIIEIEDCLLQSEKTKTILKIFKEYMIENNISAYNETTHKGDIKHIVVRESKDSFVLTVVVTNEKFNKFEPLILKLNQHFKNYGIVKNVNKLNNNVIFGNLDINVYGNTELEIEEFGVKYYVNNRSFFQVNDDVKHKIYQKIIEIVGESDFVIDAYSGVGLLSSVLAKNSKEVIAVEIIKEATENANKLKKLNNLYNLTNINGDCAKVVPEIAKNIKGDFSVVIDPPRKGVDKKVLDALCEARPNKIVYLSCNPATLARDLEILTKDYNVDSVTPYDMFPQTSNVETLAVLSLKK